MDCEDNSAIVVSGEGYWTLDSVECVERIQALATHCVSKGIADHQVTYPLSVHLRTRLRGSQAIDTRRFSPLDIER